MRIAVIVKEVPDTEARIGLDAAGQPDLNGIKWIINPYDEYAIEEAIKQAEQHSASSVVIMIGGESSRTNLTQVLALGIEEGVLIDDEALAEMDGLQRATALAAAVRAVKADVVFAGRQSVDYDWGLAGIAVAEELGWAHVGLISKLELTGNSFRTESEGDAGKLITEGELPAVFTTDKGINEPRLPSLKGIMAAKKKNLMVMTLSDLGISDGKQLTSAVRLRSAVFPPQKQPGRIIEGANTAEKVQKLIEALRSEAKVI